MTDWRESHRPWPSNGTEVQIGVLLGNIQAENRQQTAILVKISESLTALPLQIASHLPTHLTPSASAALTTSGPKLSDYTDLIKAMAWLALIIGVIVKRIAFPDAASYIKGMLG